MTLDRPVRLYLASTSPARLATLRAAGIDPIVLASDVDEDAAVRAYESEYGPIGAPAMVELLAKAKATAVVDRLVDGAPIDGFILGGDSAFELDGVIYGKPHTPSVARERWLLQRGRTGHLHSGHWLIDRRSDAGAPGVRDSLDAAGDGAASPGGSDLGTAPLSAAAFHEVRSSADAVSAGGGRSEAGLVSTAAVTFAADITDAEIDAYIATGEPLAVAGAFTIDSLGAPFITSVEGDPHAVVGLSLATLRTLLLGFGVAWPDLWNHAPTPPPP